MDTVKKTTKNIAKSNRVIANKFNIDDEDFYKNKKESTILRDIAKTNNYIAGRLSSVNEPNGLVELDENGMINSDQLPSYVDDAVEGYYYNGAFYSDSSHQYEIVPESGKIYVDTTNPNSSKSYRWTGSTYILIGCSSFNDLEPEAVFEITVDFTDPENPEYTITCNKTPDEMTSNPLIEVVILDGETVLSRNRYIATNTGDGSIMFVNVSLYVNLFYDEDTSTWSLDERRLQQVAVTGSYNDLTDKPTVAPLIINYVSTGTNNQYVVDTDVETIYNAVQEGRLIYYKLNNTTIHILNPIVSEKNDQNKYKLIFQKIDVHGNTSINTSTKKYPQTLFFTTNTNSTSCDWVNGDSLYLSQTGYVNKMYDYASYGSCNTAADTATKNCNITMNFHDIYFGAIVGINFVYTNTAENPKLTINFTSQSIKYNGQVITTSNLDKAGKAGHVTYYMFDGTYWVWMGEDNTFSGDYNDLVNKPTIPAAQIQSDWNQTDNTAVDYIKNKPEIVDVDIVENLEEGIFPDNWRTPTKNEWDYLINTRSASTVSGTSNARYAKALVNSVSGLILLPDIFTLPSGINMTNINTSSAAFTGNTYNTSQWETLENAGCIFLPAAGYRNNTSVYQVSSWGKYRSSSFYYNGHTWVLELSSSNVHMTYDGHFNGESVRLIQENNLDGLFSISANTKGNIAKSNLQFHCLNKEWRFAPNAYDVIGSANSNIAENYNGWIDLFCFGTSGWDSGVTCYQPWSISMNNADYINHDLTGDYKNADWGVYNFKKQLHPVAFSGDYNDLENKPNTDSMFIITIGFSPMSSDKTTAEIIEAFNENKVIIINQQGYYYPALVRNVSGNSITCVCFLEVSYPTSIYAEICCRAWTFSGTNTVSLGQQSIYGFKDYPAFGQFPSSSIFSTQGVIDTYLNQSSLHQGCFYYTTDTNKLYMATSTNTLVEITTTPYNP